MDLLQFLGRGGIHARLGDQAEAQELLLAAEKDVLGDGQGRQDRLLLEDHGDAGIEGLARRSDVDRLAVDQNVALVGLIDAVQHLEQRGLAGAVLADEADDLALVDGEADIVQRLHAGEGFRDVADFEDRLPSFHHSSRERSRASATAAMISRPCTPCCT